MKACCYPAPFLHVSSPGSQSGMSTAYSKSLHCNCCNQGSSSEACPGDHFPGDSRSRQLALTMSVFFFKETWSIVYSCTHRISIYFVNNWMEASSPLPTHTTKEVSELNNTNLKVQVPSCIVCSSPVPLGNFLSF